MDIQYASSETYFPSIMDSYSKRNGKDGKGYAYKKSSYQHSTSGNDNSSHDLKERNIDQLDELLEDLKNEREHTKDIELLPSGMMFRTLESEMNESQGLYCKKTHLIKTSEVSGFNKPPIDFENNNTNFLTQKSREYSFKEGTSKNEEYNIKDISYSSSQSVPQNIYEIKPKMYKTNILESSESIPSNTVELSTTTQIPEELKNIALSDDILPIPGVKVTTTVRTYTYEIPADLPADGGQRSLLCKSNNKNTIQRNESNRIVRSQPQTVVYNTESYSTIKKGDESPICINQSKEKREHVDTTAYKDHSYPHRNLPESIIKGMNKTIIYKVDATENYHPMPEPVNYRNLPSLTTSISPKTPTKNRYYYHESNIVNSSYVPESFNSPNGVRVSSPQNTFPLSHSVPNGEYIPKNQISNASTIVHKYSTTTTNSKQGSDYISNTPLTQPAPFPVENRNYPITNGSPPQRVDDLMQSFGNGDTVDNMDVETPHRKRELETAVATANQQKIPSVNKAGKDIYYPPGHEMMLAKRVEISSGSTAGGRWAKGSGMYEYESGYKSKTKTKSGGAVVPVCLPLCCAMPCSIM